MSNSNTLAEFKRCNTCAVPKPYSEYSKKRQARDGFAYRCKGCVSIYSKAYYITNEEKKRAQKRKNSYTANKIREKARYRTPATYTADLWGSLNSRTVNGAHPRWNNKAARFYLNKGIRREITRAELLVFVKINWHIILAIWATGELCSIDRINSDGDYEIDNIRFISKRENSSQGGRHTADKLLQFMNQKKGGKERPLTPLHLNTPSLSRI